MSSQSSSFSDDALGLPVVTARWHVLPPVNPTRAPLPRDSLSCVALRGGITVFGGFSDTAAAGERYFDDFWEAHAARIDDPLVTPVHSSPPTDFPTVSPWPEAEAVNWTQVDTTGATQPTKTWGHTAFHSARFDCLFVIGGHEERQRLAGFGFRDRAWFRPRVTRTSGPTETFNFSEYAATSVGDSPDENDISAAPHLYLHSQALTSSRWFDSGSDDEVALVFGGLSSEDACSGAVYAYQFVERRGSGLCECDVLVRVLPTSGSEPTARFGHSACCFGSAMFVFGGTVPDEDLLLNFNQIERLDLNTLVWTTVDVSCVNCAVPDGRMLFTSLVDTQLGIWYICGGRLYDVDSEPVDMLAFDLQTSTWHIVPSQSGPYPQTAVSMGAAVVHDAEDDDFVAVCFGGEVEGGYSDEMRVLRIAAEDRLYFIAHRRQLIEGGRSESRGGEEPSPSPDGDQDPQQPDRAGWVNQSLLSSTNTSISARALAARGPETSRQADPNRNSTSGLRPQRPQPVAFRESSSQTVPQHTLPLTTQSHAAQPGDASIATSAAILAALERLRVEMHERFFEVERRVDESNRRIDQLREWCIRR